MEMVCRRPKGLGEEFWAVKLKPPPLAGVLPFAGVEVDGVVCRGAVAVVAAVGAFVVAAAGA